MNEELEDDDNWEFDFLEDGEATVLGLLLTVADQLGIKVNVIGDQLIYGEDSPEEDLEILTKLADRLTIKFK
tara:strand:+ start:6668 stop:6883 length:216 start_codon:yes stop_codon:yes gene_type:complete